MGTHLYESAHVGSEQSALAHGGPPVVLDVDDEELIVPVDVVVELLDDPPAVPDDVLAIVPVDVDDELAVAPPPLGRS